MHITVDISHPNPRLERSKAARARYPRQPETVVAVTGTNGKTSVVAFARQFFQADGRKTASIGTLGILSDVPLSMTTPTHTLTSPDPLVLHEALDACVDAGITAAALEASSHGLDQRRLDSVDLTAAAFTNFSHEHLDYHKTMDAYFEAKKRLFTELLPPTAPAILNASDPQVRAFGATLTRPVLWYGVGAGDFGIESVTPTPQGMDATLRLEGQTVHTSLSLLGGFQVENILCALGLARAGGVSLETCIETLDHLQGIPGRLEKVGTTPAGGLVFVDYAHKPQALETILHVLRAHTSGNLGVVFGCGGDRDQEKRPLMGQIADTLADFVIVTDDNPRSENPDEIRRAIGSNGLNIGDRAQAIERGINMLEKGDILVIAGKGHEEGQIFADLTLPFSDRDVAQGYLSCKN